MNIGLFHLFLYATIILTALTGAGIYYYLADRKKNRSTLPTLGDHDRLLVLEREIQNHRERLDALIRERDALSARLSGKDGPQVAPPKTP
uniref:Phage shock protein B n=1 Tax=Leptospirillum ferriphilum TaxID=178606 RepID=A0A7C3QV46_9BACT